MQGITSVGRNDQFRYLLSRNIFIHTWIYNKHAQKFKHFKWFPSPLESHCCSKSIKAVEQSSAFETTRVRSYLLATDIDKVEPNKSGSERFLNKMQNGPLMYPGIAGLVSQRCTEFHAQRLQFSVSLPHLVLF